MEKMKPTKRPRIGIYTMGLKHYWGQFPGLKERLIGYGAFIEERVSSFADAEVFNFGLVDSEQEGRRAGVNGSLIAVHALYRKYPMHFTVPVSNTVLSTDFLGWKKRPIYRLRMRSHIRDRKLSGHGKKSVNGCLQQA